MTANCPTNRLCSARSECRSPWRQFVAGLGLAALLLTCTAARGDDQADAQAIAAALLNETTPVAEREETVVRRPDLAGAIIAAMTADLDAQTADRDEEYRRIPWIWRVAIATGKRDVDAELLSLLEASLPHDAELSDWQAVVIGGGIINGVSAVGRWPARRIDDLLADRPELKDRWHRAIELSVSMADDEQVPAGTRYDALRMIAMADWETAGEQLRKYLGPGVNGELQMGAVSGLSDIESSEAFVAMLSGMSGYSSGNRSLALDAALRSEARTNTLLDAIEQGELRRLLLTDEFITRLKQHDSPAIAKRATRLFP